MLRVKLGLWNQVLTLPFTNCVVFYNHAALYFCFPIRKMGVMTTPTSQGSGEN